MKPIQIFTFLLGAVMILSGCRKDGIDDDISFLDTATLSNPDKVFIISDDNSGKVDITPTGQGASSFVIDFGHGTGSSASVTIRAGENASHNYPEGNYTVTITAVSLSGKEVTNTYPLQIVYRAPEELKVTTSVEMHKVTVKATAMYAASYMVYFGDQSDEQGTALAADREVSHTYASAGNYDVKVVALSGGAAKTETVVQVTAVDPFELPITFDEPFINYFFGTFGGGQQFSVVANPDRSGLNTSDKAGEFVRGNEGWSGTYSPLDNPIDMSKGKTIRVWVYNPDAALTGKKLNVELEAGSSIDNGIAVLKVPLTKSGAWEELVFNFGSISGIPANEKFSQLVLRFNDETDGPGAIIYVDNFRQTN